MLGYDVIGEIDQVGASNAIVTKDAAGSRKLDRSRPTGRIDGLVAAVMAVSAMSGAAESVEPSCQIFIL